MSKAGGITGPVIVGKIKLPTVTSTRPVKRSKKNFFLPTDKCCYCNRTLGKGLKATKEHIMPLSKGGSNHLSNLKPCCVECNNLRSNYTLREFKKSIKLLRRMASGKITYTLQDLDVIIQNITEYEK